MITVAVYLSLVDYKTDEVVHFVRLPSQWERGQEAVEGLEELRELYRVKIKQTFRKVIIGFFAGIPAGPLTGKVLALSISEQKLGNEVVCVHSKEFSLLEGAVKLLKRGEMAGEMVYDNLLQNILLKLADDLFASYREHIVGGGV